MLILNDEPRQRAGVCSMEERCKYCSKAFGEYPLIVSDDAEQTVYHAACAVQLAAEIMVDVYTFFSPPAPYNRLFVLTASKVAPHPGCHAARWVKSLLVRNSAYQKELHMQSTHIR